MLFFKMCFKNLSGKEHGTNFQLWTILINNTYMYFTYFKTCYNSTVLLNDCLLLKQRLNKKK